MDKILETILLLILTAAFWGESIIDLVVKAKAKWLQAGESRPLLKQRGDAEKCECGSKRAKTFCAHCGKRLLLPNGCRMVEADYRAMAKGTHKAINSAATYFSGKFVNP